MITRVAGSASHWSIISMALDSEILLGRKLLALLWCSITLSQRRSRTTNGRRIQTSQESSAGREGRTGN